MSTVANLQFIKADIKNSRRRHLNLDGVRLTDSAGNYLTEGSYEGVDPETGDPLFLHVDAEGKLHSPAYPGEREGQISYEYALYNKATGYAAFYKHGKPHRDDFQPALRIENDDEVWYEFWVNGTLTAIERIPKLKAPEEIKG